MLRSGNKIYLTKREFDRLAVLTGEHPINIRSIEDLDRFIERHAARHQTDSTPDKLMRHLLVREKVATRL